MSQLLFALLTGSLGSLLMEKLIQPAVLPFWRRPLATLLVHLASWGLAFTTLLIVLQRPWFAAAFVTCLQLVIIQCNQAKWHSLKEPFLVQDFDYFVDAVKHPRLYLPFFGIGLAISASLAGAAAIALFVWLEPWWLASTPPLIALSAVSVLFLVNVAMLAIGLTHLPYVSLEPASDLYRLGLFAFFWAYARQIKRPLDTRLSPAALKHPPTLSSDALAPHVVVVQSESFFDPRLWSDAISPEVLATWDDTCSSSLCYGQLQVPAWGANTVRTEAAFLTGLDQTALGIHRFTPYRALAQQSVPNLFKAMKQRGYRTVAVHPYPASFYLRDCVFPMLGVDHFLDITDFDQEERDGQYISDAAVARKVGRLLKDKDNGPLFIFAITMENHGPLHLERPSKEDAAWLSLPDSLLAKQPDCRDLLVYLRHLKNADVMLNTLRHQLQADARPGILCWYGDHVPIMESVYRCLGEPDGRTSYLIWSTQPSEQQPVSRSDLKIEFLADRLLSEVERLTVQTSKNCQLNTAV